MQRTATVETPPQEDVSRLGDVQELRSKPVARAEKTGEAAATPQMRTASRPKTAEGAEPARSNPFAKLVNTNQFDGVQKFYRETMAEIRKVIWPDRETARNLTIVVIALSAILGILLGGIDYVLFQLFEALP